MSKSGRILVAQSWEIGSNALQMGKMATMKIALKNIAKYLKLKGLVPRARLELARSREGKPRILRVRTELSKYFESQINFMSLQNFGRTVVARECPQHSNASHLRPHNFLKIFLLREGFSSMFHRGGLEWMRLS